MLKYEGPNSLLQLIHTPHHVTHGLATPPTSSSLYRKHGLTMYFMCFNSTKLHQQLVFFFHQHLVDHFNLKKTFFALGWTRWVAR